MIHPVVLFLVPSGSEIIVIMFFVLMLFGADKMPELARGLGKGMRQFKDAMSGIEQEVKKATSSVQEEIKKSTDVVQQEMQKTLNQGEITDHIKSIAEPMQNTFNEPVNGGTPQARDKNEEKKSDQAEN